MEFGTITVGWKTFFEEKLDAVKNWGMTVWQASAPEFNGVDPSVVKDLVAARGLTISALGAGVPISDPSKKEENLEGWKARIALAEALAWLLIGFTVMQMRLFSEVEFKTAQGK